MIKNLIEKSFYNGGVPYEALIEYIYNGCNEYQFSNEELELLKNWFLAYAEDIEKEN